MNAHKGATDWWNIVSHTASLCVVYSFLYWLYLCALHSLLYCTCLFLLNTLFYSFCAYSFSLVILYRCSQYGVGPFLCSADLCVTILYAYSVCSTPVLAVLAFIQYTLYCTSLLSVCYTPSLTLIMCVYYFRCCTVFVGTTTVLVHWYSVCSTTFLVQC